MSTPVVGASAPAPSSASAPSTPSTSSPSPSSASSSSPKAPSSPSASAAPDAPKASSGGGDPGAPKVAPGAPEPEAKTVAAVKEEIRKLKLKVNGREMEMDEPEVIRRAQLSSAADEKFQQASEMRKEAEQFFELLRTNPKEILLHPEIAKQINFRALAEEYLGGELTREMMDPKDLELQDLREFKRKQDEDRTNAETATKSKAQQEEMFQHQQRAAKQIDQQLTEVLAKADLPKDPEVVKRVAELMYQAGQKGYELDAQTAVDIVRERSQNYLQTLTSKLEGESLVKFLGSDLVKKIRKHDLAQLKAQVSATQPAALADQSSGADRTPRQAPQEKNFRPDEWRERLFAKAGLKS